MNGKTYIIAGTYRMAEYYARRHSISRNDLRYISEPYQLRGLDSITILMHDTAWRNAKYQEIYDAILERRNIKIVHVSDSDKVQEGNNGTT